MRVEFAPGRALKKIPPFSFLGVYKSKKLWYTVSRSISYIGADRRAGFPDTVFYRGASPPAVE